MSVQHFAVVLAVSTSPISTNSLSNASCLSSDPLEQASHSTRNQVILFNGISSSEASAKSWTCSPGKPPSVKNPIHSQAPASGLGPAAAVGLAGMLLQNRRLRRVLLMQLGWRQQRIQHVWRPPGIR
ncbi:MAG: hypothetical protein KFB97_13020 [Cyanobium sp. M30B3]|nr:MAG: hypothetical protein KFB97_13020 [Cyanobium sp. M30B3]